MRLKAQLMQTLTQILLSLPSYTKYLEGSEADKALQWRVQICS